MQAPEDVALAAGRARQRVLIPVAVLLTAVVLLSVFLGPSGTLLMPARAGTSATSASVASVASAASVAARFPHKARQRPAALAPPAARPAGAARVAAGASRSASSAAASFSASAAAAAPASPASAHVSSHPLRPDAFEAPAAEDGGAAGAEGVADADASSWSASSARGSPLFAHPKANFERPSRSRRYHNVTLAVARMRELMHQHARLNISQQWVEQLRTKHSASNLAQSASVLPSTWHCARPGARSELGELIPLVKQHAVDGAVILVRFTGKKALLAQNQMRSLDVLNVHSYVAVPLDQDARNACDSESMCAPCATDVPHEETTPALVTRVFNAVPGARVLVSEAESVFRAENPLTLFLSDALAQVDVAFPCDVTSRKRHAADDSHQFGGAHAAAAAATDAGNGAEEETVLTTASSGLVYLRNSLGAKALLDKWAQTLSSLPVSPLIAKLAQSTDAGPVAPMPSMGNFAMSERLQQRALTNAVISLVPMETVTAACINRNVHAFCRLPVQQQNSETDKRACTFDGANFPGQAAIVLKDAKSLKPVLPLANSATAEPCGPNDVRSVRYSCRRSLSDTVRAMVNTGDLLIKLPARLPDSLFTDSFSLADILRSTSSSSRSDADAGAKPGRRLKKLRHRNGDDDTASAPVASAPEAAAAGSAHAHEQHPDSDAAAPDASTRRLNRLRQRVQHDGDDGPAHTQHAEHDADASAAPRRRPKKLRVQHSDGDSSSAPHADHDGDAAGTRVGKFGGRRRPTARDDNDTPHAEREDAHARALRRRGDDDNDTPHAAQEDAHTGTFGRRRRPNKFAHANPDESEASTSQQMHHQRRLLSLDDDDDAAAGDDPAKTPHASSLADSMRRPNAAASALANARLKKLRRPGKGSQQHHAGDVVTTTAVADHAPRTGLDQNGPSNVNNAPSNNAPSNTNNAPSNTNNAPSNTNNAPSNVNNAPSTYNNAPANGVDQNSRFGHNSRFGNGNGDATFGMPGRRLKKLRRPGKTQLNPDQPQQQPQNAAGEPSGPGHRADMDKDQRPAPGGPGAFGDRNTNQPRPDDQHGPGRNKWQRPNWRPFSPEDAPRGGGAGRLKKLRWPGKVYGRPATDDDLPRRPVNDDNLPRRPVDEKTQPGAEVPHRDAAQAKPTVQDIVIDTHRPRQSAGGDQRPHQFTPKE